MIRLKQANMGFEDWGLEYNNPDFIKICRKLWSKGLQSRDSESLIKTLETCISSPGVHLIDCPVDYSENDEILNNRIKEESQKI